MHDRVRSRSERANAIPECAAGDTKNAAKLAVNLDFLFYSRLYSVKKFTGSFERRMRDPERRDGL